MRKIQFVNNEYYHVFNKCIDESLVFQDRSDYLKFLKNLKDLNNYSLYEQRQKIIESGGFKELSSFLTREERVVDIISYSLSPNHYHFILKQLRDWGISKFMHKIGVSYTNRFNKKYGRAGSIFQGPFKAINIDTNEYLLWLCGYVNGNIEIHKTSTAQDYEWSSYRHLLSLEKSDIIKDASIILSQFSTIDNFINFVNKVIKESRERKDLKKYLLESSKELSSFSKGT